MINSLRVRLFAAFALVIIVSLGTVAIFVLNAAHREIDEYEELKARLELTRMEHWLRGYYVARDGWIDLDPYVAEMSVLYGHDIVVTDAEGRIVADSRDLTPREQEQQELPEREVLLERGGKAMGILYVSDDPTIGSAYTEALADSVTLFLLWGSAVAGGAALVLTLLVAHKISAPIRELADFARRAGGGDLSARVEVSDKGEVGSLASALNTMAADLERSARLRRNMVADTAHELRTPLSNITGYLEAYEDGVVGREAMVGAVAEEAATLTRLVEDLHDLARADAGMLSMSFETVSLPVLLERVVSATQPAAQQADVSVEPDCAGDLPQLIADPARLAQALHNLLTNALTHSEAGGRIVVSARNVEDPALRSQQTEAAEDRPEVETVEVVVEDTGSGIPESELENVFERYYRTDHSRARATGGSGLGLSITRQIIVAHDGSIHAERRPGGGTRMVIHLPTARLRGPDERPQEAVDS
ncbi:MAG: sensor histidine kinase [Spirochaetaceae bacterium]